MPTTHEMTVDQWISVPDHPRQRDTAARAEFAKQRHLRVLKEPHMVVHAAKWQGRLYKVDGHARAWLWRTKELARPKQLTVLVYAPATNEEFLHMYDTFDTPEQVKDSADFLFGACRESSLHITSGLLKSYRFSTQLRRADVKVPGQWNRTAIYAIVHLWVNELKILDDYGLSGKNPFIIGSALRLIRDSNGDSKGKVREFFTKVNNDQGIKSDRGRDGVQMLCEFVAKKKAAREVSGHRNWNVMDVEIRRSFKQWMDGRWSKTGRRAPNEPQETGQSTENN